MSPQDKIDMEVLRRRVTELENAVATLRAWAREVSMLVPVVKRPD